MPKTSDVWQHFTRVKDGHGNIINKATCNYCTDKKEFKTKGGTSNMWRHFEKFHPQEDAATAEKTATSAQQPQPPLLPSAPSGSTDHEPMLIQDESLQTPRPPLPCAPSQQPRLEEQAHHELDADENETIRDLARMIRLNRYDPSLVEDVHFRSFVHRLNPGLKLPSLSKIKQMCAGIFQDHMKGSLSLLDDLGNGKPSFAVGKAKLLDSFKKKAKLLEAAGEVLYITCHFIDDQWNLHRVVVNAFRILPPGGHYNHVPLRGIPKISLDDTAVSTIREKGIYRYPFMIAGDMTADFELIIIKLKECLQGENKYFKPSPQDRERICATTYMDHVLHSIARFLLPDSKFTSQLVSKLGLHSPWDYEEYWHSCYCSLVIHHRAFHTESDFERLLRDIWRVIYRAINKLLASTTPTSNLCLEELFKVRHVLQSQLSDASAADPAMHWGSSNKNVADVLQEALRTVDKFIIDSYMVWSIPLVLDPRYKLGRIKMNFDDAFGSESEVANDCTSEVTRKIKELYYIYDEDVMIEEMADDNCNPTEQTQDGHRSSQDYGESELDRYLQDSPVRSTEDFDILNWWEICGSVQYPTVAQMARDALAMPTCSKLTSDQTAHVRNIICDW